MRLNDGSVKIMDFGIALVTQGTQTRVTPRGAVIGTFRYMAPERFKGAEPDARSDIFSYGLIFYELLAGVHPSEFSRLILRIRSRTSQETSGRPIRPCRIFQVQKRRNPLRCQAIAVAGLTMSSAERQSPQTWERNTQNRRSTRVSFGRFLAERLRTPIWWRSAMFSNSSTARERNIEHNVDSRTDNRISIG
jgi:serine/threonine protein kinase